MLTSVTDLGKIAQQQVLRSLDSARVDPVRGKLPHAKLGIRADQENFWFPIPKRAHSEYSVRDSPNR
jgi:hypothetical protein